MWLFNGPNVCGYVHPSIYICMWLFNGPNVCGCVHLSTHIYVDTHTYNPYIYMINCYMLFEGTLAKSYMCVYVYDSEHMNRGTYVYEV